MKNYIVNIVFILLVAEVCFSQETDDTTKTTQKDIYEMSIEELLNLDVNFDVASTKGDNVFTSPSSVTIINKEDIERYNYTSVAEALQTVAGFSVERTYLKRNLPTGRNVLQDHYANKTLILINGVPSWNAVTGEGNLDRINIFDIERIEVLKGPASVMYGTNAYTGAVNIVLKKSEENLISAHAGYGSYNSYTVGGGVNYNKNDFDAYISLNSSANIGSEKDFTDEQNITGKLSDYIKSNNASVYLKYKSHSFIGNVYQVDESYYGVTPRFSGGAGNAHLIEGLLLNYTFNHDFSDKLNLKIGGTYDYGNRDISRTANDSIRAAITGIRSSGFLKANIKLNDILSLELGGDVEERYSKEYRNYLVHNDLTIADNGMSDISHIEYSGFSQLQVALDNFTVLVGGRYTKNNLFSGNFSPRITAVYAINEKNSIKAIYGKSYRTPSLFENYFYLTTTVFGNKNLNPETAQSMELVYTASFNKFFIQAIAYHATYDNNITRCRDTTIILSDGETLSSYPLATVYSNGNTFSANGIELEIKYANPKIINCFLNIDKVFGDDGDLSNNLIVRNYPNNVTDSINADIYNFKYSPEITISAGVQRQLFKALSISAVYTYVGIRGAVKPDLIAQNLLDLNLSFKHGIGRSKLTHIIGCKNILDNEMPIPEYSRLKQVNSIPFGTYRHFSYTLRLNINI